MKAKLEHIPESEKQWQLLVRKLEAIPFEWHFHPEYEITFSVESTGKRYIGDHIDSYANNDLTLIGPNLPHTWQSQHVNADSDHLTVVVLWFSQEWINKLISLFPEFEPLRILLKIANRGLRFSSEFGQTMREPLLDLPNQPRAKQLLTLLSLLTAIQHQNYQLLASSKFQGGQLEPNQQKNLSKTLEWIHNNFRKPIVLKDAAKHLNMSVSTYVRFFRLHIKQSFNTYLTDLRIGHACSLLIGSQSPITLIAENSGYDSQSHFNKQFRRSKQMTPSAFRKAYRCL